MSNRRRFTRYQVGWEVEVCLGAVFSFRVVPENVSVGGVCVRVPGPADEWHIVVVLDPHGQAMKLAAKRRWVGPSCVDGEVCLGLEFLRPREAELVRIQRLLAES